MAKHSKKFWLITGAVVLFILLALPKLIPWLGKQTSPAAPAAGRGGRDAPLPVQFTVVRADRLNTVVNSVGTILPNEEVDIRSEISGKVERIYFREGQPVEKGDLLLKINDSEQRAQLERARYRQAIAEQQAERLRQMFEKKLSSQEEYDNASNELGIARAEAQLIQAQIAKTEIRAPFPGMIGLRFVSEGSYLSPNTRITTLQDNKPVKIDFTVPEKYAGMIASGDSIRFTVAGSRNQYSGVVYALESKIDPSTRTMHLRALSPNRDGTLIPGAFANIVLALKERETLQIPSFALIPELRGHRVYLAQSGRAASRMVEIGERSDEWVEIIDGLQPGDTLLVSGLLQLRPGMVIQLVSGQ